MEHLAAVEPEDLDTETDCTAVVDTQDNCIQDCIVAVEKDMIVEDYTMTVGNMD